MVIRRFALRQLLENLQEVLCFNHFKTIFGEGGGFHNTFFARGHNLQDLADLCVNLV